MHFCSENVTFHFTEIFEDQNLSDHFSVVVVMLKNIGNVLDGDLDLLFLVGGLVDSAEGATAQPTCDVILLSDVGPLLGHTYFHFFRKSREI